MRHALFLGGAILCGLGLTGCANQSDPDFNADSEAIDSIASGLTCSEQSTQLNALAAEMKQLTTAGCLAKADRDRYEYDLYAFTVLQSSYYRTCRDLFDTSQKRIDIVKSTATGACMQKWCGDVSTAALGYINQLNALTCQAGLQLTTYDSLMDGKQDWCRDLGNPLETPKGVTVAPSAYVLGFGQKYGGLGRDNACNLTVSRCKADNTACRASKECHAELAQAPDAQAELAAIEAKQCAPLSEANAFDALSAAFYNELGAELQQCVSAGYFSALEQQQAQGFLTQKAETTAECNETKNCIALLNQVEQVVNGQLVPIMAQNCAGSSNVTSWEQASIALGYRPGALNSCLSNGHLKDADANRWNVVKEKLLNAATMCTKSKECQAKLPVLATQYQSITSIYAAGCDPTQETAYKTAFDSFAANDIKSGDLCWPFMVAADQQKLTTWHTGIDSSKCVFCGIPGRKCCSGKCETGNNCHPEEGEYGKCHACGDLSTECCTQGGPACDPGGKCVSNVCQSCGGKENERCCDNNDCRSDKTLACISDVCKPCGTKDTVSCKGGWCAPGTILDGNYCRHCGTKDARCCATGCNDGSTCSNPSDPFHGVCQVKPGLYGEPCDSVHPCMTGLQCFNSVCVCGVPDQACCDNKTCASDTLNQKEYVCVGGTVCRKCGAADEPCCDSGCDIGLTCHKEYKTCYPTPTIYPFF